MQNIHCFQLFIIIVVLFRNHFSVNDCKNILNELKECNKINFGPTQTLITFGVNTLWLDPGKEKYIWKKYSEIKQLKLS